MCLICPSEGPCSHPQCQYPHRDPHYLMQPNNSQILESLVVLLLNRNAALVTLGNLAAQMVEKAKRLEKASNPILTSTKTAQSILCPRTSYDLKIVISGEGPNMVFKEKGFPIIIEVKTSTDSSIFTDKLFKIRLYTSDIEPKPLKLNIASKKILRGTLESKMRPDNKVTFENVVINEVSSHYMNETFTLVISCEDETIKPLMIENLYVRARNSNKK